MKGDTQNPKKETDEEQSAPEDRYVRRVQVTGPDPT